MAKRVLYFVPTFPVISETFIEREIAKMVQFGTTDITVLALAKGKGSMSSESAKVTVFRRLDILSCFKAVKFIGQKNFKLLNIFISSFSGKLTFKNIYLFLKSLGYAAIFEAYKPEHIHVHFLSDPSTIVMLISKILNVPFSVSGHAKDVFLTGTNIPNKVEAAKFVAICNTYAYDKCVAMVGDALAPKVHKIFHGIDSRMFDTPAKKVKPARPMLFMGGTRLVEKKGINFLLEASRILKDKGIDHQLDLVGFGDLYEKLLDMINNLGLQDSVTIHNGGKGTPFSEVLEFYKIADIMVYPAIETASGDADGVPTVVIEAAMAKLPIIATNAGGISDLVDASTGIIVPQRDSAALALALENLITNSQLRLDLGAKVHAKAVKLFDINTNIKELENLICKN